MAVNAGSKTGSEYDFLAKEDVVTDASAEEEVLICCDEEGGQGAPPAAADLPPVLQLHQRARVSLVDVEDSHSRHEMRGRVGVRSGVFAKDDTCKNCTESQ